MVVPGNNLRYLATTIDSLCGLAMNARFVAVPPTFVGFRANRFSVCATGFLFVPTGFLFEAAGFMFVPIGCLLALAWSLSEPVGSLLAPLPRAGSLRLKVVAHDRRLIPGLTFDVGDNLRPYKRGDPSRVRVRVRCRRAHAPHAPRPQPPPSHHVNGRLGLSSPDLALSHVQTNVPLTDALTGSKPAR